MCTYIYIFILAYVYIYMEYNVQVIFDVGGGGRVAQYWGEDYRRPLVGYWDVSAVIYLHIGTRRQ